MTYDILNYLAFYVKPENEDHVIYFLIILVLTVVFILAPNILRLFVYAVAAAFYLKRSPQPFGNNKTYFTVHGVHMFFAFKTLERKSNKNLLCMHCRNLRTVQFTTVHEWIALFTWTVQFTCTVLGFFFSVLIVLIFFKKKLV